MKKILSIILLIGMLMSMVLVIPASALSQEKRNVADAINTPWRWGVVNNKTAQKNKGLLAFDGIKAHSYCDSNQNICTQPQAYLVPTYDINGLKAGSNQDEIVYKGIIGWELPEVAIVDTIRVYLNDIHEDGTPCRWMAEYLDIAISENSAAGSWDIVYSEDHIRCEQKYEIYEEGGSKTAYIEVTFPATEVKAFAIGIREPRCYDMGDNDTCKDPNNKNREVQMGLIRITEIEVMGYKAFNPKGYTNLMAGAAMDSYAFDTANGFEKATDNVTTHDHDDSATYLNLATPAYAKTGSYNIDGQAGTDYVGYVTYKLRSFEEIEALRVYLDEVNGTEACERMLDAMDIAISRTGKPGSWTIIYSEDNINAEKKYLIATDGEGNKTAYVEALFDPAKAQYVRIAIKDTGCEERTRDENALRSARITEIQAWTAAAVELDGEKSSETGVNSLMLFPLLMRHRQYETETSTTMFGLRVKHLLRTSDSITFEKNGIKVDIPAATLKALNLAGSDKLVVTIAGTDAENAKVTVTVNGEAIDIEGIASSTPEEPEVKGTTYRWDFENLNEKDGKNNLRDSANSTKGYTFENGCIVLSDRTTDFEMAEAINLTPWTDWSIEWKAQLSANSALFGTEASEQNFVYLAYSVSGWKFPFRMVDANNNVLAIKYGDYATLNTEMNTWKAEFSSDENRLTLKFFNEESQEWEVVGAGTPPAFEFELTHMFGRHGSTDVCLQGQVDYIEVFVGK